MRRSVTAFLNSGRSGGETEGMQKKEEKTAKNEKNNVTVPYGYFVISFLISTVIIAIGTIISRV